MKVLGWCINAARVVVVFFVVLFFALIYGFGRLGTLFIFDKAKRKRAVGKLRGWTLRNAMTTLGATFIKLGQVMSTRPDLFSPEVIDALRLLQDKVPPFGFARVKATIEEDLGAPLSAKFAELDETPVAAASVAQVHRGRLLDGREVAVKVLRPKVRSKAQRDGAILVGFAKVLELSKKARLSKPVEHMQHFIEGIIGQTDLRIEAANYEAFRKNFEKVKGVTFPFVHRDFTAERVLTMDFLRGRKVDGLGPGDHRDVASSVRNAFLKMCFEDGFVHADMHPGNMLVGDDRTLYLFDVGLVKHLGEEVLVQFIDFSRCIAMGTADDFIRHLKRFHSYLDTIDWDAVTRDAEKLVLRFRSQPNDKLEWGAFISDVLAMARHYAIRPIPELALVMVGLLTAEGIGKLLDPQRNTFNDIAAYVAPIAMRRGLVPGMSRPAATS